MSIKEALDELLEDLMRLAASYEMAGHDESRRLDAEVAAAKAVVLAMYEQQQKVADDLAEALNNMVAFHVCDNCLWPGHSCREKDCHGVAQVAAAALAAYNKAKEG